jgi:hypothetical protein
MNTGIPDVVVVVVVGNGVVVVVGLTQVPF